jgi:ABC-type Fe3+-hydroxamate transport system substrate-binding protein
MSMPTCVVLRTSSSTPFDRIRAAISIALMGMMLIIAGCSDTKGSQQKNDSQQKTNAKNTSGVSAETNSSKTGSSEESPMRMVVFSPAIGVMLQGLGFEDKIVGRHSYDTALSKTIPVVGSHIEIDYEILITVEPTDLFFEINTTEIPDRVSQLADEHEWQIWTYELKTLDDIAQGVDDLYLKLVGFPEPEPRTELLDFEVNPTSRFDIELPSARLARSWSPMGRSASNAGRMLILAGVDPPGAMGPGSFHAQMIERLGVKPALTTGGMWQELDLEDIISLNPDSIILFMPKTDDPADLIGEPVVMSQEEIFAKLGAISSLDISAVRKNQIAVVEHPLGLLPSTSLGQVADQVRAIIDSWNE